MQNDPLWNLRHSLAGVALALLFSVPVAAMVASAIEAAVGGGSYGTRVAIYAALLGYAITGAVLLFVRVAQHERTPLTAARLVRWLASLWMWPLLLLAARPRQPGDEGGAD